MAGSSPAMMIGKWLEKGSFMPIEIRMPALSPTMTEGNLAKWLKKEGDEVHSGDVLAEIETDKATMEFEAVDEGRLGRILVPEGTQGVKVNEPIAVLLGEGEDEAALTAARPETADAAPMPPEQRAEPTPAPPSVPLAAAPAGRAPAAEARGERIFASPLARRMAQQAGLDLAAIKGSGPQGRIVKADIDAVLAGARPAPARPAAPAVEPIAAPVAPAPALAKERVAALASAKPNRRSRISTSRSIARSTRCCRSARSSTANRPRRSRSTIS
jgi:pyruvate dehydrogenase E2 component (dihydrolipoamide acetyltransferase)